MEGEKIASILSIAKEDSDLVVILPQANREDTSLQLLRNLVTKLMKGCVVLLGQKVTKT